MTQLTQEQFLRDVATHQIHVLRDDGVYRHIRFKKPGTTCMHFDLVTWPGYLAYSGDMGCFVFSRIEDMFEFFRTDRRDKKSNDEICINLGYWSEKLEAVSGGRRGSEGAKEFSPEVFTKLIHEWRISWIREYRDTLSKEQRRELWEQVSEEVLSKADDGGIRAFDAAYGFSFPVKGQRHPIQFDDLFEHNCDEYTHRFIWCCYALAWGIKLYDEHQSLKANISKRSEISQHLSMCGAL